MITPEVGLARSGWRTPIQACAWHPIAPLTGLQAFDFYVVAWNSPWTSPIWTGLRRGRVLLTSEPYRGWSKRAQLRQAGSLGFGRRFCGAQGRRTQYDADDPNRSQVWYWRESGHAYLGRLPDQIEGVGSNLPAAPLGVTADGSMVVGYSATLSSDGSIGGEGFIWTQNTGLVSIKSLMRDLEYPAADWERVRGAAISPSGEFILLTGETSEVNEPVVNHAAIIRLAPASAEAE